ncbi:MAG TPA: ATP-binding cassette domain-containing protein, partial [Thermoleophilaceae bacterium]|nr:ATP-binding cassette domain-containing protein [Thermoleophilaceae bacterium]
MTVEAPVRPQTLTALAECRDVSVEYGEGDARVAALQDVSLKVGPSERLALWGRSGSGKTTLLHVLGGLVEPTAGVVTWRGEELSSLDAAARARVRARGMAYVFQGAHLLPYFTAYENVAFAAATVEDDPTAERAEELLGLVGLASKLDSLP